MDAVRIMMKLMGFLTRETNSSHASSSRGPAQRRTMSFSDRDEYGVDLVVFGILSFPSTWWGAGAGLRKPDANAATQTRPRPTEIV